MDSSPYQSVKEAAASLVNVASDAATLQSVATALKYAAESEKIAIETRNISRSASNEAFRFYVPIIAPLVSAVAVVGALVFQTIQFRQSSRLQSQAIEIQKQTAEIQAKSAEDTAWRESVKPFLQSPNLLNGPAGVTLLNGLLASGTNGDRALNFSLLMLTEISSSTLFESLFQKTIQVTPQDKKLQVLADLSFKLRDKYITLTSQAEDLSPKPNPNTPTLTDQRGRSFPNPMFLRSEIDKQLTTVCEAVVKTLKSTQSLPPASETLGLTLWNCDMSSVNFSTLGLVGSNIQGVSIVDADLSAVDKYDNSVWSNTAWWRAKRVSPNLLKYLAEKYPFSPKQEYRDPESKKGYDSNMSRLTSKP